MPFTIRPDRRFLLQCPVSSYFASLFNGIGTETKISVSVGSVYGICAYDDRYLIKAKNSLDHMS